MKRVTVLLTRASLLLSSCGWRRKFWKKPSKLGFIKEKFDITKLLRKGNVITSQEVWSVKIESFLSWAPVLMSPGGDGMSPAPSWNWCSLSTVLKPLRGWKYLCLAFVQKCKSSSLLRVEFLMLCCEESFVDWEPRIQRISCVPASELWWNSRQF